MLCQLPTKTKTGRHCIRHYKPELLNNAEPFITDKIDRHSYDAFGNYAKKEVIDGYKESWDMVNYYICSN